MSMKPTNFTLLDSEKERWRLMQPVTSTDAFDGQTVNLNEDGLYSTRIFGRVGTPERDKTESYINVKLPIFNPTYFKNLTNLKGLYGEIIKGKQYAVWDPLEKDFIKSNVVEGETGFAFFMSHFGELSPKENESFRRKKNISFYNKFKSVALTTKVIVTPAGIRDIEIAPNGAVTENEQNDLYRKLIFRGRSINMDNPDDTDPIYDNIRWGLQESFNDIAAFLFRLMEGKRGFMQRKVARRSIFGGTRNVITSRHVSLSNCDDDATIDPNSTIIGLYQALLGFNLVSVHALNNGFLSNVFTQGVDMAKLVNPKTYESEYVNVSNSIIDKWTSVDGLIKLFNGFSNPNLRNKPISIKTEEGFRHLGLVYDDGEKILLIHDKNDLPEGYNTKLLRPVTYMEFFYLECSPAIETKMLQLTRYPITGIGSIFPSKVFIMPTNNSSSKRIRYDEYGNILHTYNFFPKYVPNPSYFDGMSISNTKLPLAGGDFDGDALAANSLLGDDTIRECLETFGKRDYYLGSGGDFLYDPVIETHEFLLRALTSGLE